MNENQQKIEDLKNDYTYVDENDRTVLTVGFTASFYFWAGHTREKRQAMLECVEAFESAYGKHLRLAFDEEARWIKLPNNKWPTLREQMKSMDEDDCIAWYQASDEDKETVPEYSISSLTERGWMSGKISVLRFHVPRGLVFEDESRKTLLDLVYLFCNRLAPFHANAGLTTISTYEEILWEPEKLDVATRYFSLYIDSRIMDLLGAENGIRGINWLTFIGNTLTQRLEGPETFLRYCKHFGVYPTPLKTGFLIQAGEYPQLGPVSEPMPEEYVRVNAALRPLRNGNFGSMGTGSVNGELRFNRRRSDMWIRRFDAPGIWPANLIGPARVLAGTVPEKAVKLKSGKICDVYGRYRHSGFEPVEPGQDDDAPQVVLLPGDAAPYWLQQGPHGEYLGRESVDWELIAELK